MRRNYASLDLQALSSSAAADEALGDSTLALFENAFNANAIDGCEAQAAAAVEQLCLEDESTAGYDPHNGSIGFPIEMMLSANELDAATATAQPSASQPRPTSPPTIMPLKTTTPGGLPSIRPSANDPVRRSLGNFSSSPHSFSSKSKLSMSSSSASTPIMMRANVSDCMPTAPMPLVHVHRNVIQTV